MLIRMGINWGSHHRWGSTGWSTSLVNHMMLESKAKHIYISRSNNCNSTPGYPEHMQDILFIGALFGIRKKWRQSVCPSRGKWINCGIVIQCIVYTISTMQHCPTTKKDEVWLYTGWVSPASMLKEARCKILFI